MLRLRNSRTHSPLLSRVPRSLSSIAVRPPEAQADFGGEKFILRPIFTKVFVDKSGRQCAWSSF